METTTQTITKEQVDAVISLVKTVHEALATAPNGFPSGALYAYLMNILTLEQYNQLIAHMIAAKLIRESGNLLFAI